MSVGLGSRGLGLESKSRSRGQGIFLSISLSRKNANDNSIVSLILPLREDRPVDARDQREQDSLIAHSEAN